MKLFPGVTMSVVFVLYFFSAATAQESGTNSLPPEKTQMIYDTLLPGQEDEHQKPEMEDAPAATMTGRRFVEILRGKDIDLQERAGQWQFFYEGMQVFLLVDSRSNRIRMLTPLAELEHLRQHPDFSEIELLQKMMRANYLATGDTRLCMNRHILWAAFLHPLDSLTERDFVDALRQLTETVRKTREIVE